MHLEHRGLPVPSGRRFSRLPARGWAILGILLAAGIGGRLEAQPACVSGVRFELEPQAPLPDGLRGKLILSPKSEKREPLILTAQVGSSLTAELPCNSQWELAADFPNAWGPRGIVVAGVSGAQVSTRLALWPLGRIAGSVKLAEKGERMPRKILVTTLTSRSRARRDTPQGAMDCPVDAQGRWSCPPLPATAFDLVMAAEGFIPQYRWDLAILPEKTTDLGTLILKKGASVAGWVEVDGGAIDPACRARLTPLLGPGSGPAVAGKVRSTAGEVAVRKDGFFQIVGVAPGAYSLEIRQPGFAAATLHPITVSPRSETFLRQPIVLKRPLEIELAISPPLDWLDRPWKILLLQASNETGSFDRTVYAGKADEQGNLKVPPQAPGRFKAYIADSLDNQLAAQTFQVTGPEDAAQAIQLKILTVQGTIRLGREPLAATLWFDGRRGSSAVKLESDQDGKFHGVLPRDGWWVVDISSSAPRFETRTKVKVETIGQDRARADLDLPATRVFGQVLDEAGHPMPAATLMLSTDEGTVNTDTDETGSFDVRGLPAGLAHAGATLSSPQGRWASDQISLFLRDGEDFGPLEVRMRKEIKLSGSVQSVRGPVAGAGVTVLAIRPVLMGGDSLRTDLDGTFTAHVPAITDLADVVVSAPGYALKAFSMAVGTQPAQPLILEEQGGALQLFVSSSLMEEGKDATSLWIFQNGLPLPNGVLFRWAEAHGRSAAAGSGKELRSLTVPELAAGEYRACLAPQAALAAWQASGWTAPLARCATGALTAGGTLRLDLAQP